MKSLPTIVFFLMLVLSALPRTVKAAGEDIVAVSIVDANQAPLADIRVDLLLYEPKANAILEHEAGHCTTDQAGRCQILIANPTWGADGLIRGRLDLGPYGSRSLIWAGGPLEIFLWLDVNEKLDIPTESDPYEGQEPHDGLPVIPAPKLRAANVLWPVLIVSGCGVFILLSRKVSR